MTEWSIFGNKPAKLDFLYKQGLPTVLALGLMFGR